MKDIGRKETLELEEKLEKMEDLVEKKKRDEEKLKMALSKLEKENIELKKKVKHCEVVIVEVNNCLYYFNTCIPLHPLTCLNTPPSPDLLAYPTTF